MTAEQRIDPRSRTLKTGKIVFNGRTSVIDCMVRNLSSSGACLKVTSSLDIPDSFDLTMECATRACTVVWKTDNQIGVSFNDQ